MDSFAQAIEGWHDFYMMIGAAATTLVGLLFVSLSLNVDFFTHESNAELRELAIQTFTSFLFVTALAVTFLIPDQDPLGLGLPLLGMGGFGLYMAVGQLLKEYRMRSRNWDRGDIARHFAVPVICYLALTIIAVQVLQGQTGGLYWLVPVMIVMVIGASRNAWDLLLRQGKPTKET